MLKQLSALLLFSVLSFPQNGDSLKIKSIQTELDTTITSVSDTVSSIDTSKTIEAAQKDTLVPIQGEPLTDVSTIISKRTFLFDNYRYTGDLLRSFSLNFVKDLGFVGYPHETFIYGVGNSGISYLQDGLLINNRFTNSLDLNFVQSEDIDSIEIVPSPRGFLYGPYNNPVTVNFITRDFISPEPYSRIRYYEGPDGEAMIDGKFNAMVAKKWNLAFQVTNRIADETYANTEFSIWQVNAKLKYILSNSVNITGSYYFVGSEQGLNGGVDIDSLLKISDDPAADLYEPFFAPVLYPNRLLDVTQHNVGLKTLAKPFDNSRLELSLYYRGNINEVNDIQDTLELLENSKENIYGGFFTYFHRLSSISLQLFSSYETNTYNNENRNAINGTTIFQNNESLQLNHFNIGGMFTLYLLKDAFQAAVFFRYNNLKTEDNNSGRSGQGFDLRYSFLNNLKFYLGLSGYENYDLQDAGSFEFGAMYNLLNLFIDFKYFSTDYNVFEPNQYLELGPEPDEAASAQNVKGLGLNLNYKFWIILLESNFSYYDLNTASTQELPDYQFIGGAFINDMFFDDNLNLKAGFKFYYTGEIQPGNYLWYGSTVVNPSNKLEFTLAGEIGKVAIFYFAWDNLFDSNYYITPYYPMLGRNIRFGLAWELFN